MIRTISFLRKYEFLESAVSVFYLSRNTYQLGYLGCSGIHFDVSWGLIGWFDRLFIEFPYPFKLFIGWGSRYAIRKRLGIQIVISVDVIQEWCRKYEGVKIKFRNNSFGYVRAGVKYIQLDESVWSHNIFLFPIWIWFKNEFRTQNYHYKYNPKNFVNS